MHNLERRNTKPHEPALDDRWYPIFQEIGSFQAYEYLDGDKAYREEQKRKFLSGETANPSLDYPKIDLEKLARYEQALMQLKADIIHEEQNDLVKQVYRWRLNEKLAELRMLKAAASGETKRFKRYSEFIYGKPAMEIFAYTVDSLKKKVLNEVASNSNVEICTAGADLLKSLPDILGTVMPAQIPEPEMVGKMREATNMEFGDIIKLNPEDGDKEYSATEIQEIFSAVLAELNIEGWQVIIDCGSKSGISVDQEKKWIKIPEARKLTFLELKQLIVHEIGTHVARRSNGERSRLHLLGLGLDRYEVGEEGVATAREQALEAKVHDFSGLDGHLAISLALGLDGKPRSFREVFEVFEKYEYYEALKAGKDLNAAKTEAQRIAWNRCVRTFRGTDCATPGVCFTKDIVYREGNIGTWEVVRNNPEEVARFSVGKYNPANPRHIWILDQLGISDADLTEMAE